MNYLFNLRSVLRSNGVYVAKDRRPQATALAEIIGQSDMHEWTEREVIQHVRQRGSFNSPNIDINYGSTIRSIQNSGGQITRNNAHFEQPDMPSPPTAIPVGMTTRLGSQLNQAQESTPSAPPRHQLYNPTTPGITTTYEPAIPPVTPGRQDVDISYTGQHIPPHGGSIGHLRKAYNEEIKYRGSEDSFDMSYCIFIEFCDNTGIRTPEARQRAFWVMLKGDAL